LLPNPYTVAVGKPEDYRAFTIPASVLKNGMNTITITQKRGGQHQLFYLDIAMP